MSSSRFSIVLLFIVVNLSNQQNGSSALTWSTDIYRKIRKNPSRFHLFSINSVPVHQNRMRQRPGLDGMRIAASKASSMSIDDGNNDDDDSKDRTRQSSTYSNWLRKDPRNRSVSGILICTFYMSTIEICWIIFYISIFLSVFVSLYLHHRRRSLQLNTFETIVISSFFSVSTRFHYGGGTFGKLGSLPFQSIWLLSFITLCSTHNIVYICRLQR